MKQLSQELNQDGGCCLTRPLAAWLRCRTLTVTPGHRKNSVVDMLLLTRIRTCCKMMEKQMRISMWENGFKYQLCVRNYYKTILKMWEIVSILGRVSFIRWLVEWSPRKTEICSQDNGTKLPKILHNKSLRDDHPYSSCYGNSSRVILVRSMHRHKIFVSKIRFRLLRPTPFMLLVSRILFYCQLIT